MSGRILIADSVAGERIVLKARLAPFAYETVQAADFDEMLQIAQCDPPDLILLPQRLGSLYGAELCARLRTHPQTRSIPLILRLDGSDCRMRIDALEAGADAVVDTKSEPALLSARIRNLLRRHASEAEMANATDTDQGPGFAEAVPPFAPAGDIVLIVPNLAEGVVWRQKLAPRIRGKIRIMQEGSALPALRGETAPDAIVVAENVGLPQRTLRLISDLRCRSQTMHAAILLVQPAPAPERAVTALDVGVSDLVETGFDAEEVALRLRRELARKARADGQRAALRDRLKMAVTDPLTGLFNRGYAMNRMEVIAREARRAGECFAVMMLDLDRFKTINDTFGHAAGDAVLVEVARRMSGCLRNGDLLARIGGEEFLAVVRNAALDDARTTANRIRCAIAEPSVELPNSAGSVTVTASIGLVTSDLYQAETAKMLEAADRALYAAKADGRNLVMVQSNAA
ncbi:diguanylate cyclase [Pseudoruegeria sp. HB172150]|uniref:diguanylate cyclase n=1 Tax=Pseudoruegeria sp. HB172150 TaxID=2721164 RepID=UPI0015568FA9|nr:diguanylate cyclase [Pseudoruegeria sp. HB172150]